MKFICEERNGKIWVRGKCCVNRETGELREDYSDWIVKELEVPTPNVPCNEDGCLIWEVVDDEVRKGVSPLTDKEQQAITDAAEKTPEALLKRIVELEASLAAAEGAKE
ncbi:hypothetical protein ES705_25931 [subsurface metagenome]